MEKFSSNLLLRNEHKQILRVGFLNFVLSIYAMNDLMNRATLDFCIFWNPLKCCVIIINRDINNYLRNKCERTICPKESEKLNEQT